MRVCVYFLTHKSMESEIFFCGKTIRVENLYLWTIENLLKNPQDFGGNLPFFLVTL